MPITATGATDGANIVLFWPELLPEDADARLKDDPIMLAEELQEQGKLIWFPCEGDGFYSVAVYIREEVPKELLRYCIKDGEMPQLLVRGEGFFGGMEWMWKSPAIKAPAGALQSVSIPPGEYRATVFETDVPEEAIDAWFEEHTSLAARNMSRWHGRLASAAVAMVLATLIAFFVVAWLAWFTLIGVCAILIAIVYALTRTKAYHEFADGDEAFGRAFPSYVVTLE